MTSFTKPAAVILAGGRSSRMGAKRKALLEFGGLPLLSRVIHRLQTQSDPLLLSCDVKSDELEGFGLSMIPDLLPGYRGPLTGLYSTLQYLSDKGHDDGLVLCPCDAPFIPYDLVQTILKADTGDDKPVITISYEGVIQPTFSLWHGHHLPAIRDAVVKQGFGSLKHLIFSLPHTVVEWASVEPPPFFNINTPQDLKAASMWLD